jgi:hypothetical protein
VDLDETLYGDDDIEDDLDYIIFSPVTSSISKWPTIKHLRRVHVFNRLVDLNEILHCGNGINGDLDNSKMAVCLSHTNNV